MNCCFQGTVGRSAEPATIFSFSGIGKLYRCFDRARRVRRLSQETSRRASKYASIVSPCDFSALFGVAIDRWRHGAGCGAAPYPGRPIVGAVGRSRRQRDGTFHDSGRPGSASGFRARGKADARGKAGSRGKASLEKGAGGETRGQTPAGRSFGGQTERADYTSGSGREVTFQSRRPGCPCGRRAGPFRCADSPDTAVIRGRSRRALPHRRLPRHPRRPQSLNP